METNADTGNQGDRTDEPYVVGQGRPPREYMWKPGQSGNPSGRPKGESLTALLRRRLDEEHNGRRIGDIVIEALIKGALQGKHQHLKELLDRAEGKVADRVRLETDQPQGLVFNIVTRDPDLNPHLNPAAPPYRPDGGGTAREKPGERTGEAGRG